MLYSYVTLAYFFIHEALTALRKYLDGCSLDLSLRQQSQIVTVAFVLHPFVVVCH